MLKVNNIDVCYGRTKVLRGVSVFVEKGEIVTLIGANGAGKTTFLMTLSGILKPSSGTIEFLGSRIDNLPPHAIVSLGLLHVPQGRQLFPKMTVMENLDVSLSRHTSREERIQKLEAVYGDFQTLGRRANQRAGTLSGGEQQMLAIGRTLMANPKLLLMDEPSSGLAPIVVQNLGHMISNLRSQGMTILLVEQNAYLALELADRGYLLQNGEIVASGRASELAQSELVKAAYLGI